MFIVSVVSALLGSATLTMPVSSVLSKTKGHEHRDSQRDAPGETGYAPCEAVFGLLLGISMWSSPGAKNARGFYLRAVIKREGIGVSQTTEW